MTSKAKKYSLAVVFALLVLALVSLSFWCASLSRQVDGLYAELNTYREKEGQSYVVERISKQMEDIAYQQKDISEKQREEALYQMGVAQKMRARAEAEQRKAQEFARNVVEARNMAEEQRELAIDQQHRAEFARNVADTLSYVALGRALAMLSSIQYRADNKTASALLAYASWKFTSMYKGDVYQPVLFDALSQNSATFMSRNLHKGGVTRIVNDRNLPDHYVSVSDYGEVCRWQYVDGEINHQLLFSDPAYSFRDVYVDAEGVVYALSYQGELVVIANKETPRKVVLPESRGWLRLAPIAEGQLLLLSSANCYFYDIREKEITKTMPLPEHPTALTEKEGRWFVFGDGKGFWEIKPEGNLVPYERWISNTITAAAWSPELKLTAIGVKNGDIYVVNEVGNVVKKLVGHQSQVSQLGFKGQHLFSSSYDRMVCLWDMKADRQEPVSLKSLSSWVYGFCLSGDNTIWVGDASGSVSRIMVSPDEMAELIQKNLRRDFTEDEWNYYVGSNVPRIRMMKYIEQKERKQ